MAFPIEMHPTWAFLSRSHFLGSVSILFLPLSAASQDSASQITQPGTMAKKGSNKPTKKKGTPKQELAKAAQQETRGLNSSQPEFSTQQHGPVILFRFTAPGDQHQALARMESFYESCEDARRYLTLQNASTKPLCRNYQAFNLPIRAIYEWLQAMQDAESMIQEHTSHNAQGWWSLYTTPREACLLDHLSQVGCFNLTTNSKAPSYLISVIENSALPHEMLHALYFLHSGYRGAAQQAWKVLSKKCRAVVGQNFTLRGYGEQVWIDEFQAYVSEDGGEFGKKVQQECNEVKELLLRAQYSAWLDLRFDAMIFLGS